MLNPLKNILLKAVAEATKIANNKFEKAKQITEKKDSLVTNVDLECNRTIIKTIKTRFMSHNIVSEETGVEDNKSDYTWYIDPIDGTHNFARKIPIYGVSVALACKGRVIMGAVSMPYFNNTYFAEKGRGAFLNNKKMRVSKKKELNYYMIGIDFPSSRRQYSLDFLNHISRHVVDVRQLGCAVYQAVLVAEGKIDAYVIQHTNPWDIAASFLLIEEAGGKVTNFEGREWSLEDKRFVATNGLLHKEILGCVRRI